MFAETRELPECLKAALKSVGYFKRDVELVGKTELKLSSNTCFSHCRSFTVVVDLASGTSRTEWGSWGGANPFEAKAVDRDETMYPMTIGVAVIKGESGGNGMCFAKLYLHPDNIVKMLPEQPTLTERQKGVLKIFDGLKPAYRKSELEREGLTTDDIEECLKLGFLDKKGNGTKITTAGKNALNNKG